MSQKRICHVQEQHHHVEERRDLINTLNHDSLAQIFMLLPVPERITIKKICSKWKEACELAWYDIKEYTFGGSSGPVFDERLLAPSYVDKLLSNFGIYLRELCVLEICKSSFMPIISKHCKNLTSLDLTVNGKFKININHYIHAFKKLDKLKKIHIRVINIEDCNNTKFRSHIINYLPEEINQICLDYGIDMFMPPLFFNIKKFKKLQYLALTGCLLDDIIQGISETTTLVELSLIDCFVSENCLYNPVDIFNQFVNLEYISINNQWDMETPNLPNNILNSSKSIRYFNIMLYPNFNAPDISIKNWDNLLTLKHFGTRWRINDNIATKLVKYCKNLMSLDIWSGVITETAFLKLSELKNLGSLNYCFLNGISENEFNEFNNTILTISTKCKTLKHLIISNHYNDIDDNNIEPVLPAVIFDELSKLEYLEYLNVSNMHNFQDSSIIAIVNKCKNLRELDVSSCIYITEAALMSITNLKKLEKIDVSNMDSVTDNFISKLKGLKRLVCESCKNITDAGIIQCIKNCPNLDALCLYRSNITINTLTSADEITENRINNIVLYIFYNNFTEASKLKTKSNWLVLRPEKWVLSDMN